MTAASTPTRYRFGDSSRVGVLLGCTTRQAVPLVAGTLWLTLSLMAQVPLVGLAGPLVGVVLAFGRWRGAPLYEVAVPSVRLRWRRLRRQSTWTNHPAVEEFGANDMPDVMRGLDVIEVETMWTTSPVSVGVVCDRLAGVVSLVVPLRAVGFPVASAGEQDQMCASWGAALAPLARAHCPVSRVTWQEWTHPVGLAGHREFLAHATNGPRPVTAARVDYEELLDVQAPFTVAHDVLVTVTVELRRVRARRATSQHAVAIDALIDEARLLTSRLEAAGINAEPPVSPRALSLAVRVRSDPSCARQMDGLRRSLAAAVGRGSLEFAPMAVAAQWAQVRVDGSFHRSYRVAAWPMLPVPADWLAPLLMIDGVTRTVTVVMEPVALGRAAADANRQLTSIEADQAQKERHGFRLTARERRRHGDVEARERELAEGHPEFRHVAFVTVTAASLDELDDAASRVEQAAAQSQLDLRPLSARQGEGWVLSLPLGRSVRLGGWLP